MLRKTVSFWIGVLFCVPLLFLVVDRWQFTKIARRVSGKVTATSSTSRGCGSRGERAFTGGLCKSYEASILYVVDGKPYRIEVAAGSDRRRDGPSAARYLTGQYVRIAYDPRSPDRAYVDRSSEIWSTPLLFLLFPIGWWIAARAEARLYANSHRAQEQAAA